MSYICKLFNLLLNIVQEVGKLAVSRTSFFIANKLDKFRRRWYKTRTHLRFRLCSLGSEHILKSGVQTLWLWRYGASYFLPAITFHPFTVICCRLPCVSYTVPGVFEYVWQMENEHNHLTLVTGFISDLRSMIVVQNTKVLYWMYFSSMLLLQLLTCMKDISELSSYLPHA
jgi:hypothetical protein